jgi:hypothetical protein
MTEPSEKQQEALRPLSKIGTGLAVASGLLASAAGVIAQAKQIIEPFTVLGAPVLWGIGAVVLLTVMVVLFIRLRRYIEKRWLVSLLWIIPLMVAAVAGTAFGAAIWSPTRASTSTPAALSFAVIGQCTETGGELSAASGGFSPGRAYTISVSGPDGQLTPDMPTPSVVGQDGKVAWRWSCAGKRPGRYTTELSDSATGRRTGPVEFFVSPVTSGGATTQQPAPSPPTSSLPFTTAPTTTTTSVQPPVSFTFDIRPGEEPQCADYTGKGTPRPGGKVVVLMLHRPNDDNWFSEKQVQFLGSDSWFADNVTVGGPQDTGLWIMEAMEVTPAEAQELTSPRYSNLPAPHLGISISNRAVTRGLGPNTC